MFYTNNSIRLHSKALAYLELIQQSNNRYEEKRSLLARYDATKDIYSYVRLMNERYKIVEFMERWETLSSWLVKRYLKVLDELRKETFIRTSNISSDFVVPI